ncbi:ElyC/SanA/YdcF family protein [Ruminococcus sp.]|uniref:ElyC/SanA/YdcF family protein n=1 Tax=Ruminococcus sp. TaxID=41978 RepID=UPI002590CF2A|nr:ElyC/SanA/YdcF family protein [Ruminococcus sp.]MCR5019513.1 YdcF family protein [Ruminococcus sp.]
MTFKYVILAVEIFFLLLFIAPFPILNAGNIAGIAFFGTLIAATAAHAQFFKLLQILWSHTWGKVIITAVILFLIVGFTYVGILSAKMYRAQENEPKKTDLIIVLGCKVKGERPSRMLRRRLDVAYEAMQKHPDALVVLSGGKGSDEKISEAEGMRRYLVEKGADESRLIMEDKSTNTFENIKFSFAITDKLGCGRDITIVTDGFHQYRASLIAKQEGAKNVTAYSANTQPKYVPTYWVREWLGLTHFFVFGN